MLSDVFTSKVRTIVPMMVGGLISWISLYGIEVGEEVSSAFVVTLTFTLQALYYVAARLIETRYPRFGWLLGSPKQPNYRN